MVTYRDLPLFSAVSGSARQLFLLLKSIGFSKKALVQISDDGLRFSSEDANVMEGMVFLDKSLFTTYHYENPPPPEGSQRDESNTSAPREGAESDEEPFVGIPPFEISMTSFLEVLQIFGLTDSSSSSSSRQMQSTDRANVASSLAAFDPRMVGLNCVCRLVYTHVGGPLVVVLSEGNISTTASVTAYEPLRINEIPFDRQSLSLKVIMKSSALYDAINELSSTDPARLTISASSLSSKLSLMATSDVGSTIVDFFSDLVAPSQKKKSKHSISTSAAAPSASSILETFLVPVEGKVVYDYKFGLVKHAVRAMGMATKLSLRIDDQGVMNMQFMIELENGPSGASGGSGGNGASEGQGGASGTTAGAQPAPRVAFVDFRFVPFIREDEDDEEDGDGNDGGGDEFYTEGDLDMRMEFAGSGVAGSAAQPEKSRLGRDSGSGRWNHSEDEL